MRLRFTIRDLLWLAVVIALAAGWWLDHRQLMPWQVAERQRREKAFNTLKMYMRGEQETSDAYHAKTIIEGN